MRKVDESGFNPYADFEVSCRMFSDELYATQFPSRIDRFMQGAKEASSVFMVGAISLMWGYGVTGSALPSSFEWRESPPDCGQLDTKAIQQTRSFLGNPDNLYHNQAERTLGFRNLNMSGYFVFVFEIAKKHGLTLVNPTDYVSRLGDTETKQEIIDVLNKFGHEYGLEFDFVESESELDERGRAEGDKGDEPIAKREINADELRDAVRTFMRTFYLVPKELIQLSNVKTIRILKTIGPVDNDKDGDGEIFKIAGKAYGSADVIAVNYESFVNVDMTVLMHELSHKTDQEKCGDGRYNDTAFNELNPENFDYGKDNWPNKATSSEYGATALIEDKAEIGELILPTINFQAISDLDSKHVSNKVYLWLSRLEEQLPGITAYLAAISHPAEEQVYGPPKPVPGMP